MKQARLKRKNLKCSRIIPIIPFLISFTLILLAFSSETVSSQSEERIRRVENGLLKLIKIKGQRELKLNISDRMEFYKVPGVSIAVINNHEIEWAKGYGVIEAKTKKPVTTETLFQAASISKPIAAAAALHMVEQGLINLEENVNNKLTSWKVPENKFTSKKKVNLRGLLSHSAGVTVHGFRGYAQGESVPTLIEVLNGKKPANSRPIRVNTAPDKKFRYSGGGYTIMQQLLIDLKSKPFPEIMRETVLNPLDMSHSTYEQPLPENKNNLAATAHRGNGKPIQGKWHTYPEMAAAGLWTTPSDLARFAIEVMMSGLGKSNQVLSREMTKRMLTAQHGSVGLGLFLGGKDQDFNFSHSGGNEGFRCHLFAYPEKGKGAVIMTNSDNGFMLYSEILRSIAAEYSWSDFKQKEKLLAEADPEIYDSYTGKYQLSPNTFLEIMKEDNRLFAHPTAQPKYELFPESKTEFFITEDSAQITFVKNLKGKVTKLIFRRFGRKMTAKKIK